MAHACAPTLPVRARTGQNVSPPPRAGTSPVIPHAGRRAAGDAETRAANRAWWDAEAEDYHAEHGAFR